MVVPTYLKSWKITCLSVFIYSFQEPQQTLKRTDKFSEMSKQLLSGHKYEELKEEEVKAMDLDAFDHGLVRIQPEGWLYPGTTPIFLDGIYNMKVFIHSSVQHNKSRLHLIYL